MVFAHTLSQYMSRFDCSVTRLAQISGMSKSTISRYKTGVRLPEAPDTVKALCEALLEAAGGGDEKDLFKDLNAAYEAELFDFDYEKFSKRLDKLIRALKINITNMAMCCSMDVSNLSRVRSGLRKPRDPHGLIPFICDYVVKNYKALTDQRKVAELMGASCFPFADLDEYRRSLSEWLSGSGKDESLRCTFELAEHFELMLDEEKLKRKTSPLQTAVSKAFVGLEAKHEAIEELLLTSLFSRSPKDLILYSDGSFSAPSDETVSLLFELIQSGRHINLVLGIGEASDDLKAVFIPLLPLVLSGGLSLYAIDLEGTAVFTHLLAVSGSAALFGDSLVGMEDHVEFKLTREAASVASSWARAEQLLSMAKAVFVKRKAVETKEKVLSLSMPRIKNIKAFRGENGIVFTDALDEANVFELVHEGLIAAACE